MIYCTVKVSITQAALRRLAELNKTHCCIHIRKGGCFGYHTVFSFEKVGDIYKQSSVDVYVDDPYNVEVELTVDYIESLVKTGFEVHTNMRSCCCNKSFGTKINPGNCVS